MQKQHPVFKPAPVSANIETGGIPMAAKPVSWYQIDLDELLNLTGWSLDYAMDILHVTPAQRTLLKRTQARMQAAQERQSLAGK